MLNLFTLRYILLNIIHQIVGQSSTVLIPSHLMDREINISNLIIPAIILSFSLITIAKYRNSRVFAILSRLFLSSKNLENTLKEELRLTSVSSVVLILNYFLVLNLCLLLSFYYYFSVKFYPALSYAILSSFFFIGIQILGLWLTGIISGERKTITTPINETLILFETSGFLLFFIALCWTLNPEYSALFFKVFVVILLVEIITRFLKCSLVVLNRGVSWYYIILYLCTLEILPMMVVLLYIDKSFIY